MKFKKVVLSGVCAAALVVGTVAGTMAYLTSSTEVVANTFTMGKVEITLDEADVNDMDHDGNTTERVKANTYKVFPGGSYAKDPTIHVDKSSENCWVFVKVDNGLVGYEADASGKDTVAEQMAAKGWLQLTVNGEDVENVYYYKDIVNANDANGTDLVVFTNVYLKDSIASMADASVTVDAYAIQSDSFGSAAAAWAAAPTSWTTA